MQAPTMPGLAGGATWLALSVFASGTTWPDSSAILAADPPPIPKQFGVHRILIDPGHGAPNNPGSLSGNCESEGEITLRIATDLARRLNATGAFLVRLSRESKNGPTYQRR